MRLGRLSDTRRSAWIIVAIALAVGGLALWSNLAGTLNHMIEPLRFGAVSRAASGRVVVVEMDAASTAAIKRWPWSRANYAQVVDALRRAGAASIVFDVDFSSSSDSAGDAAFAASLARSGGIVALPTFGQQGSAGDARTFDALPIPALRRHVALASVSVSPGPDGIVRDMPFGTVTAGVPRPSLSAYIAGRSGRADDTFPIDMSIDPQTIPRLSFVAVRDGRFTPAAVRGRNVLIGATAIEMGDRYGTSSWGVVPGVVIQALAAETLIRGVPARGSSLVTLVLAGLLSLFAARAATIAALAGRTALSAGLLVSAICVGQYQLYIFFPVASGLIVLSVTAALSAARLLLLQFRGMRLVDEASGMPNRRAMLAASGPAPDGSAVAVLRIANFETLLAVLGRTAEVDLIQRVTDRARLIASDRAVYRIADRLLAFAIPAGQSTAAALDGFRAIMLQPLEITGRRVDVTAALGLAQGPSDELDRLLSDAARAAEQADEEGGFWRLAETNVGELERAVTLMGELDAAIAAGILEVHYQPKLDLRSGAIVSAEALVRWRHPERGPIPPDVFVPMAEHTDRIAPLTLYVLSRALTDLTALRSQGQTLSIAVNISAKLLGSAAFTAELEAAVACADVPPESLIFEVTESAAMSHPEAAVAALERFRALGVAVSMDDYGTGQSTLTYLRKLPLNELKIDRSFVQHAHLNQNDALLVRSTVELAHDMGLKVVAEGVEDESCLAFLQSIGCDMAQGYFISRPLPIADFIACAGLPRRPVNDGNADSGTRFVAGTGRASAG